MFGKNKILAFSFIAGFLSINILFFQNFIPLGQESLEKENNSFDAVHQAVITSDLEMEDHQDEAFGVGPEEEEENRKIDSQTSLEPESKDVSVVRKPTSSK